MGVEIKLTDKDFPVSAEFIEVLHHDLTGQALDASWHDQLSEALVPSDVEKKREVAQSVVESVTASALMRCPVDSYCIHCRHASAKLASRLH